MESAELTKAWLSFLASLTWPAVSVAMIVIFRRQFQSLIERLKSGEVVGAKFSFNETASGFIQSKIDDLAQQSDPTERAVLAGEIKEVAAILGSIHPISLAVLINAAEPGGQLWTGPVYLPKKKYFEDLERAGLSKTIEETMSNGLLVAKLQITDRGKDLLRSIGMEQAPDAP